MSRDAAWAGGQERLQPQILKVLILLVSRRGEVVTRDELVQLCWDGRIIGEDVINRAISLLRNLAERAGGFEIETVRRTGYRLIETRLPRRRRTTWLVAASVLAGAAAIGGIFFARNPELTGRPTLTVAVAPFAAEDSSQVTRTFAAAVHESIVRMLNESGVSVISDTGRRQADLLLTGQVAVTPRGPIVSVSGEEVGRHAVVMSRWLESHGSSAAELPDQVGANVAASLSWVGPLLKIDARQPSDPAFITQLLDQTGNEDFDLLRAYQFALKNAPNAPGSAIAQIVLAMDTGIMMANLPVEEKPKALAAGRQAAARALTLAPHFGDVYIPWCQLHPSVLMHECEQHLRAGLSVDPSAPFVGSFLGHLMQKVGRTDEAVSLATDSLAEDQYVPGKIAGLVGVLEADGQSKEADAIYRRGVLLWPHVQFIFWRRVIGISERGDFDALERLEQQIGSAAFPAGYQPIRPLAEAVRSRSIARVREACAKMPGDLRSAQCMLSMAQVGDLDGAFKVANALYPRQIATSPAQQVALWLSNPHDIETSLLTGSGAVALRRDPRFLDVAERVGLLAYWRSGKLPDFCTKGHEPVCAKITGSRAE
jgi:hypothetical protein